MLNTEMILAVEELLAYERATEELKIKSDAIRKRLKDELNDRGVEELVIGDHVVRNTSVLSSRFDTKRFKEDFGASAYAEYCKEVASKRFSIV